MWSRDGKELFFVPAPGRFVVAAVKAAPIFTVTNRRVELVDGGQVRIAALVASNRRGRLLNHLLCERCQRADNESN